MAPLLSNKHSSLLTSKVKMARSCFENFENNFYLFIFLLYCIWVVIHMLQPSCNPVMITTHFTPSSTAQLKPCHGYNPLQTQLYNPLESQLYRTKLLQPTRPQCGTLLYPGFCYYRPVFPLFKTSYIPKRFT